MTVGALPWRVGSTLGRTLYDADDQFLGVLDTQALADRVVDAVNRIGTTTARATRLVVADQLLERVRALDARLPAELAEDIREYLDP